MNFTRSLRFQITTALMILLFLFSGAATFTFYALEEQRNSQVILNLAAKLQLTGQQLVTQGMHYLQNAPPDKPTYDRDIRLYYRDLMGHVDTFDMLCDAFTYGQFEPKVTGLPEALYPSLNRNTRQAVDRLEAAWNQYRRELMEALGPDLEHPRLQAAAYYVSENEGRLEMAADALQNEVEQLLRRHMDRINLINQLALAMAFLIAVAIIFWFFQRVIKPMELAAQGFTRVAQGDFGYQVAVDSHNEIAVMSESFNHLSRRLHAIFRLIDRIQQGSDLANTLKFVGEDFSRFLPLDWLGVLFVTGNGSSLKLEQSFINGVADSSVQGHYRLQGTLIEKAIASGIPQHIPDMEVTATQSADYVFLRELVSKGMHDAIFLPFTKQSPVPGVLAFASRSANVYTREHLELLTNIAHLVTHSFSRTVKLVEHARLAAVGEFASGVAHEIRSPLATVGMALDYFKQAGLPASAHKRALLASQETERMARLLDDMLLYAKPLSLNIQPVDLSAVLGQVVESSRDMAVKKDLHIRLMKETEQAEIYGEPDRLLQIFLNLAANARDAALPGSSITWSLTEPAESDRVSVIVHNDGEPISEATLVRVFEPFFTTKPGGTGLGLSIVKRMVEAHDGDIRIESGSTQGTRIIVSFPRIQA